MQLKIQVPPKLIPIFTGEARYRGAYGGRGSAKTRTFAKMAALRGAIAAESGKSGLILCGREFQNSLEESSFSEVRDAILSEEWLREKYEIGEKYIRTKDGRVNFSFSGLRHNIASIKSKSKILILWIDEAEPVTEECWRVVTPTVREEGSEIWVTWNPERKGSATDLRFKQTIPDGAKITEMNWRDNPWFPEVLNDERLRDQKARPEQYNHVWEGGYLEVATGAYFSQQINKAKAEDRWGIILPENPLLAIRLFADIGGTGATSDNFVFWAAQFGSQTINLINHYEAQGQEIGAHLDWLHEMKYTPRRAQIILPHDGTTNDRVYSTSYEKAFQEAGYHVETVPNQGRGAAKKRIESVRNNFNRMYFSERCQAGMDAISWYHPKIDPHRQIDLGPEHDWASHSADAIGLCSICYRPPRPRGKMVPAKVGIV